MSRAYLDACRIKPLRDATRALCSDPNRPDADRCCRCRRGHSPTGKVWVQDAGCSLHLATAVTVGVEMFLTSEAMLARCSEVQVEVLSLMLP